MIANVNAHHVTAIKVTRARAAANVLEFQFIDDKGEHFTLIAFSDRRIEFSDDTRTDAELDAEREELDAWRREKDAREAA